MDATKAAAWMNHCALEMRRADLAFLEHETPATHRALDEAVFAYRRAADVWAAAYALEFSGLGSRLREPAGQP